MSDWLQLLQVCDLWHIDPATVLRPKDFKDTISATNRRVVIRELRKLGFSTKRISVLVPLTDRAIREAIAFKRQ